jgi:hypothetical protein
MRSSEMGWTSALLGLACHFAIALTAAAVYFLASRKLRILIKWAVSCGLLYGELVFLFMYFVVLPLSRLGPAKFNAATYITGPVGHPLLVGLPIALSVRHFAGSNGGTQSPSRIGGDGEYDSSTGPSPTIDDHYGSRNDLG